MSSDQAVPGIAMPPQPQPRVVHKEIHIVPQGPVLTEDLFNKMIATIEYHLYDGTTALNCAVKLRNGFTVVGQAYALPTGQFDLQLGMQYALQDAKNRLGEILSLMVYDLVCPERLRVAPLVEATLNALKESANA